MRIGIVSLGGKSSKAVAQSCKKFFGKVDLLDIRKFEVHISNDGVKVTYEKKDLEKYDCLYVRGSYKYALLQRSITRALCQEVYMPISPEAFTIGHDKFLTLLELQKHGVPIPKTYYAATTSLAKKILENEVDYPVIMKLPEGTHGKGVMIADSLKSARTVLDILDDFNKPFIIQEFVETKDTSDIRVIVVGDEIVAAYKRQAAAGEVRTNIHAGGTRAPYTLTDEEIKLALDSAASIGAGICGIDILNAEKPSVIEINLSPGLSSVKEVTGIDVMDNIANYLYKKTVDFKKEEMLNNQEVELAGYESVIYNETLIPRY